MYDPISTLHAIDRNMVPILILSTVALIGNYIFFFELARCARRDKCYNLPLTAIYLFILHDLSYILYYDKWFNQYNHWFSKLYLIGLLFTAVFEVVFLLQTIKYGRREMFPSLSQRAFTLVTLAGLVAASITWWCVKQNLNDDIYVLSFFLTTIPNPALCMGVTARRQSRKGTSVLMWQGYTLMVVAFFASTQYFGGYFNSLIWYLVGAVSIGWGLAMLFMVKRLPPYDAAQPVAVQA